MLNIQPLPTISTPSTGRPGSALASNMSEKQITEVVRRVVSDMLQQEGATGPAPPAAASAPRGLPSPAQHLSPGRPIPPMRPSLLGDGMWGVPFREDPYWHAQMRQSGMLPGPFGPVDFPEGMRLEEEIAKRISEEVKSELEAEKTKVATMQDASSEVHELEKENSRLQDEMDAVKQRAEALARLQQEKKQAEDEKRWRLDRERRAVLEGEKLRKERELEEARNKLERLEKEMELDSLSASWQNLNKEDEKKVRSAAEWAAAEIKRRMGNRAQEPEDEVGLLVEQIKRDLKAKARAGESFDAVDTNGDGLVDRREFEAAIRDGLVKTNDNVAQQSWAQKPSAQTAPDRWH